MSLFNSCSDRLVIQIKMLFPPLIMKGVFNLKIRHVLNGNFTLIDDIAQTVTAPAEGFYWIDANNTELVTLQSLFNLHDLAVEDCLNEEEQRPKIELYDHQYFIVINSIRFDNEEFFLRGLNIFLGKHYIITVTKQKINELRLLKARLWDNEVSQPDVMLYHLIDLVIDNYAAVGDRIDDRIETLEEDILMHTKKQQLNEIIGLRSEILWVRKILGPQRELIATIVRK